LANYNIDPGFVPQTIFEIASIRWNRDKIHMIIFIGEKKVDTCLLGVLNNQFVDLN